MNISHGPKNIFLTGFMGVGKSTIGRLLSQQLNWLFKDLDNLVEKCASKKINEIFKTEGEIAFRRLETSCLEAVTKGCNQVISLGGGALLAEVNQKLIIENGQLIYLRASVETLITRVQPRAKCRPLLSDKSPKEFSEFMTELFKKRESAYEAASIKIDTDEISPNQIVEKIVQCLNR